MTPERHIPADGKSNRVTRCQGNVCNTPKRSFSVREEPFLPSDLLQLQSRSIRLNKVCFKNTTLRRHSKLK